MRTAFALSVLCCFAFALPGHTQNLEYVVEAGESLASISAQSDVYDDPLLWPLIYKFNRDQIKDPAMIYPGQRLQIPVQVDASMRARTRAQARAVPAARGH